jgi:histidinol-phosphate/aromatic aminotransferase/cobyric acid decarboxylase-like protein
VRASSTAWRIWSLNTNESPVGSFAAPYDPRRGGRTLLYPDPQASALRAALATYHRVRPEQVFVGNGSDEVLAHAFAGLLKHDGPLLFPDITYSFYPVYCRLFGIAYKTVPLDQAMQIRVADYDRPAGAIIIPNPNAPTGVALSRARSPACWSNILTPPWSSTRPMSISAPRPPFRWSPRTRTFWSFKPCPSRVRWPACGSAMRSATPT